MTQRVYWVPHTLCFLDCAHCHNDSRREGEASSPQVVERIIAHLPSPDSAYPLEDVLIGGGEALMRNAGSEHLIRTFRARFPRGPQATVDERRAGGHVILALQTTGLPLATRSGQVQPHLVKHWLDLGVDYFQVASSDMFHRRQRPAYPWEVLEESLMDHGRAEGVEFMIYGKNVSRLVPSGRVLENLQALEAEGASLLTAERYCADGWETASRFLSGTAQPYPHCSEVVVDPAGWVHPCCWYELSPGLFDLSATGFAQGMDALRLVPLCQALDRGDMYQYAHLAGIGPDLAHELRDRVGDCGACRLASTLLVRDKQYDWIRVRPLGDREQAFYRQRVGKHVWQEYVAHMAAR